MGRSVSTPSDCTAIAYQHHECEDDLCGGETGDCTYDGDWWQSDIDSEMDYARTLWPSLSPCGKNVWLGREDHAYLENEYAYVGVSEYCGVTAIWLKPKETDDGRAAHWCSQIAPRFLKTFSTLARVATMSNGETIYRSTRP